MVEVEGAFFVNKDREILPAEVVLPFGTLERHLKYGVPSDAEFNVLVSCAR